jgi:transcriptional regulator with XRE-family HTH domain
MNRADDLNPKDSLSHLLAFHLRRYREDRGMTQGDLASLLCVTEGHLGNLERARRRITMTQARDLDKIFGLPRWFELLHHHAQGEHRDWLAQYTALEQEASELKVWQPLWVPGLLQTKAYARVSLIGGHANDIDAKVAARLDRQAVLGRENPPYLWILLDERVLTPGLGDIEVMKEQIARLLELSERTAVTLQLVPADAGPHAGLDGGFNILTTDEGEVAYVEAPLGGRLVQDEDEVKSLARRYDHIRSLALPMRDTRARLLTMLEDG